MENGLKTLLGSTSNITISKKMLVAQDDIRSISKTVDMLVVEFDQ